MKDKRFEKIREGLYQELLKANQHFKICWSIRLASEDIARATRVHLTFFYYTMWGNNDRFCVAIYNVVKTDPDTANFQKLFNYITSSKNLSSIFDLKEIEKMEAIIQSHQSLIDRIKVIRDQYVAHNQLTKNHLTEQTTYKYEEGKRLLIDLNSILQKISLKYDRSGYLRDSDNLFAVTPSLNVEYVLRSLTEHYNSRIYRRKNVKTL